MSSEDPPAYEPPGPEITGQPRGVDDGKDTFKDEPAPGDYSDKGDPSKCNFSPALIIFLVILNLIVLGVIGYLIWYAVDEAQTTPAPTRPPTPLPTGTPTKSLQPSGAPTISHQPSLSFKPSLFDTLPPTTSSNPTGAVSSSPTNGPFFCNLCGEGKTMSTTNLQATVTFSSRVSRTCQELRTDQNNGDILEEQCIALYDAINANCGCVTTVGARDDASITTLLRNTVGSAIDTSGTNEATALAKLLDSSVDTYFASAKATATDEEIVQRYLLILAYYQLNAESSLTADLYTYSECSPFSWSSVASCEYGQVTGVYFSGLVETASSTPSFPSDLLSIPYLESLRITSYSFGSAIPSILPENDYLQYLDLSFNELTGTIPDALFELRSLTHLDLSYNALSGDLTSMTKIKQLIRLNYLDFGSNLLTGTIQTCSLSTTPTTMITDCGASVSCSCCSICADTGTAPL